MAPLSLSLSLSLSPPPPPPHVVQQSKRIATSTGEGNVLLPSPKRDPFQAVPLRALDCSPHVALNPFRILFTVAELGQYRLIITADDEARDSGSMTSDFTRTPCVALRPACHTRQLVLSLGS